MNEIYDEEEEDKECPLCCDDPCTCFEGTRICERCGKKYDKYSRIHTCSRIKK